MTLNVPDVPYNVYTLLTNAADAVDTTNGSLNTSASNLNGMQNDTNRAVTNVTTTSQGLATDTLKDVWTNTQTDMGLTTYILSLVTGNTCMGGSPNPLRKAVEAGKTAIQNGIQAIDRRSAFRKTATSQQLDLEDKVEGLMQIQYQESLLPGGNMMGDILSALGPAVEQFIVSVPGMDQTLREIVEWTMDIQNMEGALGNVALALEFMLIAINNLNNNGFSSGTCATGFVPGQPLPLFPTRAFLMNSSGSGGTDPYQDLANRLKNSYTDTNINIDNIVLWGEEQHLSPAQIEDLLQNFDASNPLNGPLLERLLQEGLINGSNADDVISMLKSGVDPQTIDQWLTSGRVNASNIGDVTPLCQSGVDPQTIDGWLTQGRNVHQLAVTADTLARQGVSSDAIKVLFKQNINFSKVSASVQTLLAKGVSMDTINYQIEHSTKINEWQQKLGATLFNQDQIAAGLQRWKNGTSLGSNDGGVYTNYDNAYPTDSSTKLPIREYYVPTQSSSGRILIDGNGKAYFYPDHYNPRTRFPIPFDVILSLLG